MDNEIIETTTEETTIQDFYEDREEETTIQEFYEDREEETTETVIIDLTSPIETDSLTFVDWVSIIAMCSIIIILCCILFGYKR
ncbi:MAG: hypothetical protein E7507_01315 [Ruminococcus sp.]|nr:hypothetical protein [Ruminococcus sp.]